MSWQESIERIDLSLTTALYVLMVGGVLAPLIYVVTGLFGAWRKELLREMSMRRASSQEDAWEEAGRRVTSEEEEGFDDGEADIDPGFRDGPSR